jgi:hypothetical protein
MCESSAQSPRTCKSTVFISLQPISPNAKNYEFYVTHAVSLLVDILIIATVISPYRKEGRIG